jgi:hypothetical protein
MFTVCVPLNSTKYESFLVSGDRYRNAAKTKLHLEDTFYFLVTQPVPDETSDGTAASAYTVARRKVKTSLPHLIFSLLLFIE